MITEFTDEAIYDALAETAAQLQSLWQEAQERGLTSLEIPTIKPPKSPEKVIGNLTKARALVDEKWCQNNYLVFEGHSLVNACAIGALAYTLAPEKFNANIGADDCELITQEVLDCTAEYTALTKAAILNTWDLPDDPEEWLGVVAGFNDDLKTTKSDVLTLYDKAIKSVQNNSI